MLAHVRRNRKFHRRIPALLRREKGFLSTRVRRGIMTPGNVVVYWGAVSGVQAENDDECRLMLDFWVLI
jgi:hypothetical protein